jgi:hypothetical protein
MTRHRPAQYLLANYAKCAHDYVPDLFSIDSSLGSGVHILSKLTAGSQRQRN